MAPSSPLQDSSSLPTFVWASAQPPGHPLFISSYASQQLALVSHPTCKVSVFQLTSAFYDLGLELAGEVWVAAGSC